MNNQNVGPTLSDAAFFEECLQLDLKGMESVKESVKKKDFIHARSCFAQYVRESLDSAKFRTVPYEEPENCFRNPDESEEEICTRLCDYQLMSVGILGDFRNDRKVDWEANLTPDQYKEWTWQLNRHNDMKYLAHSYKKTGNPVYAQKCVEMMHSWIKQMVYPGGCPGHLTKGWRTIECGIRMGANWPYILQALYNTEFFTDDILVDWYKSVYEHGERLSTNHTRGNWLIMEMNGLAHIGILYPVFRKSQEWKTMAITMLEQELERQIYEDGFQYELSTNYHNVVINNYIRLMQTANAYGVMLPEGITSRLQKACEVEAKLMMPDRTVPDLNDGCKHHVRTFYERRKLIYPDNSYVRWILENDSKLQPDFQTIAFPWSGFMVMRTGWTENDTWALFDAAPFGKAHQHEDKLSVLFYANGKFMLAEGGNYLYDTSAMRQYILSTKSHNTVIVDHENQNRRINYSWKEEEIHKDSGMKWKLGQSWDYAEGTYREGYGKRAEIQAIHNRRVFFYKPQKSSESPYMIVVDRLTDCKKHSYECLWHIDDELLHMDDKNTAFKNLIVVYSTGKARIICGQKEPEYQGFIATGTSGIEPFKEVNCLCVEENAESVRIVTVLYAGRENAAKLRCVIASRSVSDEDIEMHFSDGKTIKIKESQLISYE